MLPKRIFECQFKNFVFGNIFGSTITKKQDLNDRSLDKYLKGAFLELHKYKKKQAVRLLVRCI